jgi:hypothetical protein
MPMKHACTMIRILIWAAVHAFEIQRLAVDEVAVRITSC